MELLTTAQTAKKVNKSVDYFRKVIKHEPDFPKPVKLTPRGHPMWPDEEIDNYLKRKAA